MICIFNSSYRTTPSSLASLKSRMLYLTGARLAVLEKKAVKRVMYRVGKKTETVFES